MKIVDHDQRRQEIAGAAAKIIAEHGIDALTTRCLSQELGCSLGALSHYFSNKEEIILAALNLADQRIFERITNAASIPFNLDQFKPIVLQVLPLDKSSDREWRVRLNLNTYALTHPDVLKQQRKQLKTGYKVAGDLISQLQAAGEISVDIEAKQAGRLVVDMMTGLAMNLLMLPYSDRQKHIESIEPYWEALRVTK
jgi:AcrR family transcriptional regulator